jgi:hypothetical protein
MEGNLSLNEDELGERKFTPGKDERGSKRERRRVDTQSLRDLRKS